MVRAVHRPVCKAWQQLQSFRSARNGSPFGRWAVLRVIDESPSAFTTSILEQAGVDPAELARPETRILHRLHDGGVLEAWVARTGDETIGLRAGASVEPGDLDAVEYAARSCSTLREAIECAARYLHLIHEGSEATLIDYGPHVGARGSRTCSALRCANDFMIVAATRFAMRCVEDLRPSW